MMQLIYLTFLYLIFGRDRVLRRSLDENQRLQGKIERLERLNWRIVRLLGSSPDCPPAEQLRAHERVWEENDRAMELLHFFRSNDGSSINLLCINFDAETADTSNAVELESDATNWTVQRFYGRTLVDALEAAAAVQRDHDELVKRGHRAEH